MVRPIMKDVFFLNQFTRQKWRAMEGINKAGLQIYVDADAVDYALIGLCRKGDLVVTQDYGVAAMALGKGAYAIHQSGKWQQDGRRADGMNGFFLLIPFLMIRFGLLSYLNKDAVRRAAYFAPMSGCFRYPPIGLFFRRIPYPAPSIFIG